MSKLKKCTTDGRPPIDPNNPSAPGPIDPVTGQHTQYWVLCKEERAKGFVRPVRTSYVHRGAHHVGEPRPLTDVERESYDAEKWGYVAFIDYPESERPALGVLLDQRQMDSRRGEFYGGCGTTTHMGRLLAETYARDPKFYGSTFCVHCGKHFPVAEFVWSGTVEVLGS